MQLHNITRGIKLIHTNDIKEIRNLFNISSDPRYFTNIEELKKYIFSFDISLLFDNKKQIKCIFHEDKRPSTNIHYHNGSYLYTCHSNNCACRGTYNIITLIAKIKSCSSAEAFKYACEYLNCGSGRYNYSEIIKENIKIIKNLKDNSPIVNKILGKDKEVLLHLYNKALSEKIIGQKNRLIISISNRYLMKEMNREFKVSRCLAILGYLNLIKRIPLYEIHEGKLENLMNYSRCREEKLLRVINTIEILDITNINEIEINALRFKKLGYSKRNFTAKEICEKEGWWKMIQLYPQL